MKSAAEKEEYNKRRREWVRAYFQTERGRATKRRGEKAYYEANKTKFATEGREYRMRQLGTTVLEYDKMLASQNGRCAICDAIDSGKRKYFSVDHCHVTGKIRGLLCHKCNLGLGMFKDSAILVNKALCYLHAF